MPNVAAVRLTYNPKVLWFDPADVEFSAGDALIVRTERGLEYGVADEDVKTVDDEAIASLRSPLKPVVRKATPDDTITWQRRQADAADALPVFKDMVAEYGLDMRPVTVEFLFDGDKAIFYFESEERVDFRELVRALASHFHVRIDMRQIGVRDEARIVGGYGHCGQELCCRRLGGQFNPVSIRMAKDQDLSLNPQKISGLCGRLMCCLRYEADTYKEFKTHCPKLHSMVSTPEGDAKVLEINVPCETVTLSVGDKRVKVPVDKMDVDEKTGRPNAVSAEVLEECRNQDRAPSAVSIGLGSRTFSGTDKVAEAPVVRHAHGEGEQQRKSSSDEQADKKRRHRRHRGHGRAVGEQATDAPRQTSTKGQRASSGAAKQASKQNAGKQGQGAAKQGAPKQASKQTAKQSGKQASRQGASSKRSGQPQTAAKQGVSKSSQAKSSQARAKSSQRRPGQRSSSLSAANASQASQRAATQATGQSQAAAQPQATQEHRRSRRRSHKAQGSDVQQH